MQAVSDAHTHLFTERERLLQLRAENDALRAQELADRARIQRLLSTNAHACHQSQVSSGPWFSTACEPLTSLALSSGAHFGF